MSTCAIGKECSGPPAPAVAPTPDESSVENQTFPCKRSFFSRLRVPQVLVLGYGSLGAIYGDIGTSPLYVLNTIFADDDSPSREDVLGAVSCIFWVFTLIVIAKYALLVLQFGTNYGEGGQVALYCKISRLLKTGPFDVKLPGEKEDDDLLQLTRSETMDSTQTRGSNILIRDNKLLQNPTFRKIFRRVSMLLCFIGGALVISDGLLTPTTSVLSAIEGISIVVPSFTNKVMPVSVCILILLFAIQRGGTKVIAICFSPLVLLWFITIAILGIMNICRHPDVFKALSPKEAVDILKRRKGIDILGSVVLSITGCEAMFADVGHFSPSAVQLTLTTIVYPSLMLAYLGQGAYIIDHPTDIKNVFYKSIPGGIGGGLYWYVFVLATLGTIIASQALILGVFSILKQMIQIDCFPHFTIVHKSEKHIGRIYLPAINFLLMIFVICTCIGFRTSANVTAAYGLGVSIDFMLTTIFMSLCFFIFYRVHWVFVLFFLSVFGSLEMTLVIANLKKVPHGAWFTLMVSSIMLTFFVTWRLCRDMKIKQEHKDRVRLKDILLKSDCLYNDDGPVFKLGSRKPTKESSTTLNIRKKYGDEPVALYRYKGVALMYTSITTLQNSTSTVPKLFEVLCESFPHLPEIFIFLCIRTVPVPHIEQDEKVVAQKIRNYPGFYRCIIRTGFMDDSQISELLLNEILNTVRDLDCDTFDQVVTASGTVDTMHIFGREVLKGHRPESEQSMPQRKYLHKLKKTFWHAAFFFRSFIIEYFFQPLNDLKIVSTNIVPDKQDKNLILIGKEVEM